MIFKFKNLFVLFLLKSVVSFGQEPTVVIEEDLLDTKNSTFYREDQVYLGVSFVALESNLKDFDARGLSSHFQWGIVRDFPIVSSGQLAMGVGLGMGYERFNTNLIRTLDPAGKGIYSFSDDSISSLFFSMQSLELPLSLRWRSSSPSDYAFWRVYGGVSLQWNYSVRAKQQSTSIPLKNDLQPFGASAHLSFGYNTWNFYLAYRLTPFFKIESLSSQSVPIDLTPIKVGLIFYLL